MAFFLNCCNGMKKDPIDAFEQDRNNVIYGYHKNRNPFINHPDWINAIRDQGYIDFIKVSQNAHP